MGCVHFKSSPCGVEDYVGLFRSGISGMWSWGRPGLLMKGGGRDCLGLGVWGPWCVCRGHNWKSKPLRLVVRPGGNVCVWRTAVRFGGVGCFGKVGVVYGCGFVVIALTYSSLSVGSVSPNMVSLVWMVETIAISRASRWVSPGRWFWVNSWKSSLNCSQWMT